MPSPINRLTLFLPDGDRVHVQAKTWTYDNGRLAYTSDLGEYWTNLPFVIEQPDDPGRVDTFRKPPKKK